MKPQRVEAAKVFKPSNPKFSGDRKQWISDIRKALYASKIISYTQVTCSCARRRSNMAGT